MDSIWPQQDLDGNSCMFHRYLSEDNIFDNSEIETDISTTLLFYILLLIPMSILLTAKEYFTSGSML